MRLPHGLARWCEVCCGPMNTPAAPSRQPPGSRCRKPVCAWTWSGTRTMAGRSSRCMPVEHRCLRQQVCSGLADGGVGKGESVGEQRCRHHPLGGGDLFSELTQYQAQAECRGG